MPPQGKAQPGNEAGAARQTQAFERYRPALRAYAYARVRDWEAAEDLAQEAVIRALGSPRTPEDPQQIPHYLRRILKNLCINFARDRRPTVPLRLVGESDRGAGQSGTRVSELIARAAEEEFLDEHARERIMEAIEQLPKRLREVLLMRAVDGLSYAEMGRFLDIKPQTINWRLHKARQLLAEELEMAMEEPARGPLSCRQCRRLLSPFIDGELEFPDVRRVHQHLHECERCSEELERVCDQMRQLDFALAAEGSADRIKLRASPRVWRKAWELMAQRVDDIARSEQGTLKAITAFAVPGLSTEQLDLLLGLAQTCVEANPDSPLAFGALSKVHIRRHEYQPAEAAAQREIELGARLADPVRQRRWQSDGFANLGWAWDHLASQARHAGDTDAAMAATERVVEYRGRAIELDPDHRPWKQSGLATPLAQLGQEREALRHVQGYLRTMAAAGARPMYMDIARALSLLGRPQEALEYRRRDVAAKPLDVGPMHAMEWACQELGQAEEEAFWRTRAEALRKTSGAQTRPWLPREHRADE
ncbi:MAG: sigma-70 family RNA polymerase sigma factor [Armatimonadota bacterium]|jgi:RNA polymerase sigma-70 factor (ECF subfamily)